MDLKKCGALIAARRKELGLTQKDLAQRLNVTDKAISRWETGKGFPESALLQPLANALQISIAEIVNGQRTQPETAEKDADDALIAAMEYGRRMKDPVVGTLLMICGTVFALAPLCVIGTPKILLWGVSAVCYVWGSLQYWGKWPSARASGILGAVCMAAALILQAIPGSAVLVFSGPDYHYVEKLSCFDLMLVGYAMFWPWLSAVLNGVNMAMMGIAALARKEKLKEKVFISTIVSCGLMLMSVLFGQEYLTLPGFLVALLLGFSALLQSRANAK